MRVNKCSDADEAFFIMRGINNRLGIIEDFLMQEDMSDSDRKHWQDVADQYRELRGDLSKKKFNDKQWSVFINYNALDKLDQQN